MSIDGSHFHDALTLMTSCKDQLDVARKLHDACVARREIDNEFHIVVKHMLEDLRSALDYCAVGLCRRYGSRMPRKIYFPYAKPPATRIDFGLTVEQNIPGLTARRPDIVACLTSYQWFGNTGNWLPQMVSLVNEQKHVRLIPLIENAYKIVTIEVTIPPGATKCINLHEIPLGDNAEGIIAAVHPWNGIAFEHTGVSVMHFLDGAVPAAGRLLDEVSRLVELDSTEV